MDNKEVTPRQARRSRVSLFWPVVLIVAGVLFLLDNLGKTGGGFWNTLINLWPLLLVLIGVDSLIQRKGIVGAVFTIALGVVFLLINYNLLALTVWGVLLRVWPLILLAAGFDILVARRSWLLTLLGVVLILALLAGVLWYTGARLQPGQAVVGETISQPLEGVTQARLLIEPAAGALRVKKLSEPTALVMGTVPAKGVSQNFSKQGDLGVYVLRGPQSGSFTISTRKYDWDLSFAPGIPLDLQVSMGAGDIYLDLTGLKLSALRLDLGAGQATVILPETSSIEAVISGAVGQLVIIVPKGLGVRYEASTAIGGVSPPSGYQNKTSPNYASAEYRMLLKLNLAIGSIVIKEQ